MHTYSGIHESDLAVRDLLRGGNWNNSADWLILIGGVKYLH